MGPRVEFMQARKLPAPHVLGRPGRLGGEGCERHCPLPLVPRPPPSAKSCVPSEGGVCLTHWCVSASVPFLTSAAEAQLGLTFSDLC